LNENLKSDSAVVGAIIYFYADREIENPGTEKKYSTEYRVHSHNG